MRVAKSLLCLVALWSSALAGCGPAVRAPETLNESLTYLPWNVGSGPGAGRSTYVLTPYPGMKLTLNSEYTDQPGLNSRPPILAQSIWEVPSNSAVTPARAYSAADRIFVSWLLQGSLPTDISTHLDPIADARQAAQSARSFDTDFLDAYYGRIVRSLTVEYTPNKATANKLTSELRYHAAWIQALVCHNARPDADATRIAAQALAFSIPSAVGGSTPYRHYNWTSFWALEAVSKLTNGTTNTEYYANPDYIEQGRGLIDVTIPIRVYGAPNSTYVSICTTVRALEERWGVDVLALRRYRSWLPKRLQTPSEGYRTYGSDDYITIKLDPTWHPLEWLTAIWPINASSLRDRKDDLLLAPGDVIFVERRDDRASDVPPTWMPDPSDGAR